ncbi:MAG: ABC transporter ATP-binding protein [Acidobacteriota bacterium]|nr:ABC transporter ATP-binding protein [Acidobacteriota bacterium]
MRSDVVIRAERLGKKYFISHEADRERYTALRDVVPRNVKRLFRSAFNFSKRKITSGYQQEEFWALKDINFEIQRGDIVGIIGRNGAGKSTLLKILSRITEPSEGRVEIEGRVASLLEVGTGFHLELTGRENIYLNGAILGMSRAEIKRRFDEIVAFADIEKFLDTPVKRYSSGMYMRLAFAVAAHLEPEILIVDEVLAVGDAAFQKKCIGRMGEVAKRGRTVLFVSHDMRRVTALCHRGILLNSGRVEAMGTMAAVVGKYLEDRGNTEGFADLGGRGDRSGTGEAVLQSIELLSEGGRTATVGFGDAVTHKIEVRVYKDIGPSLLAIIITSDDGVAVHELLNLNEGYTWIPGPGNYEFNVTIPKLCLYPGGYSIDLWLGDATSRRLDYVTEAMKFHVIQTPKCQLSRPLERVNGLVFQCSKWECDRVSE